MNHHQVSLLPTQVHNLGHISQTAETLVVSLNLLLHFLLLPEPKLAPSLVENLFQSGFFMSLDLFLEVLFSFALLLFTANYLSCFVYFFVSSGSSVRQLDQISIVPFLALSLVVSAEGIASQRPID